MGNDKCQNFATIRRFWPGREPDLICIDHATDSKKISEVMGFYLHFEPISYGSSDVFPNEPPMCACSAGFSQRVEMKGA